MARHPLLWLLSLTVIALALAGALWWVGGSGAHPSGASADVGAGAATGHVPWTASGPSELAAGPVAGRTSGPAASSVGGPVGGPMIAPMTSGPGLAGAARSDPVLEVLRRWDRARARAYAAGDLPALRSLYVAGSEAATADARLLRGYLRRGLRVEGMRTQLLAAQVLSHRRAGWRLRVTDRLDGAVAVDGAGRRMVLPRDRATTRVVTLQLRGGRWRVAAVR